MELSFDRKFPGLKHVFDRTLVAARKVMARRVRLILLVRNTYLRLSRHENIVGQFKEDVLILARLVKAWALGRYRGLPWKSVLYAVAAILYFLNPIDLIPDAIVGIGFLDDAAVAAAVVRAIHKDLQAFKNWENAQAGALQTGGEKPDEENPDGELNRSGFAVD